MAQDVQPPDLRTRVALSLPEAAAAMGVSERHLRNALPEIPHVHIGTRVVIPVEGLREWLRTQAQAERNGAAHIADGILDTLNADGSIK